MTYVADSDGNLALDIQVIDAPGNVVRHDKNTKVPVGSAWEGSQQEKWSYTIPSTDTEAYKYVITYKTKVDKSKLSSSTNGVVSNEASNDRGGSTGGTGVVPDVGGGSTGGDGTSPIVAGKSASKVTQDYIDWDIVVFIPKGTDYTNGLTITDELPWHYGNAGAGVNGAMVDTLDTSFGKQGVKVEGLSGSEDYTVEPRTSNDLYLKDADGQTLERHIVDIKVTGLGKAASDRTLTVKVRTLNSAYWLWAGTKNSEFTRHTNNAIVDGVYVSGTGQPMLSTIEKKGSQVGRPGFVQGDDGSIYFRYDIQLTNVHDGDDGNVPVVITDTFDSEYLEFVPVGVSGAVSDANYQNVYIRGGANSYSNDSGSTPHVPTFKVNGNQLTITANADDFFKKEDGTYYPYYHLYYYLKLKNDVKDQLTAAAIANGGTYKLANTAEWEGLTAQNDVDYTVPTVQKDGWFRDSVSGRANNRLFDFFVDVNPERYELNGGNALTITDDHTNNLTVDYSTVRVYEVAESVTTDQMKNLLKYTAKLVAGDQLQDWEQKAIKDLEGKYEQAKGVTWDFSGNQGTFNGLQDKTHYVIAYSALIIGSGDQGFSNEVSVNGFTSSKSGSRNFGSTSTAGADVFQIQLLKHEYGMTSNGLKGATFQLFVDDGHGTPIPLYYGDTIYTRGTFSEYPEEYKQFASFNAGKQNLVGQPITFTTNETGYLLIALNQTIHGAQLDENVHYYLKEVESPAGYKIDSSVEYWSFTLTKDPDSVSYGGYDANGSRQWIYFYYDDILKMSNTRISQNEYLDVKVNKTWLGENGQPLPDVEKEGLTATVKLFQKVDDGDWQVVDTIKNKDGDELQGTQELNKANNWSVDWGQLVRSDDMHTYAYKVEEGAVQGFISSMTSKETSDKEGNTTLTFSATNQKEPSNPPTKADLKVKKTWLKEDAETPETDNLPEYVYFQLFQVVSRTPFATTPTAGGKPFDASGLIDASYIADVEAGKYKVPKSAYESGVVFKDLITSQRVTSESNDDGWYFYSYYIKEVEVEGYDQSVTQLTEGGTTTFTMVNTAKPSEKTTTLQVAKKWQFQNADGTTSVYSPTAADEVHFVLYQVSSNKPFADPTKVDSGGVRYNALDEWGGDHWARTEEAGTYEIGRNWNWNVREFKNLPSVSIGANGKATYYAYYVREVDLPDNVQGSCTITANDDGTYTATITNTKLPEQTSVEVSKKWTEGGNEIPWPADTQVLVTLLRDGTVVQNADGAPKTVTLSNEATSAKFEGLPKTNANGNDYVYTVKEQFQVKGDSDEYVDSTTVDGKAAKATITPTDGGYTITNDLQSPGSLKVTKTINNTQNLAVDESKITFTVTGPNGYNQTFTYADMQGSPKAKTLTGLNPGTYTVKETDTNTGVSKTATYTVTQQGTEAGASQTGTTAQAQVKAGQTTEVSFTNTYSEYNGETTQFTLNKEWSGVSDADKKEVKFKLYRMEVENTEGDSGAPSGDLPIEVYGGTGWFDNPAGQKINVGSTASKGDTVTFTYRRVTYRPYSQEITLSDNVIVGYYHGVWNGWQPINSIEKITVNDTVSVTFTIPEEATKILVLVKDASGFEGLLEQEGNAYFSGSNGSSSTVYPQSGVKTQADIEALGGTLVSDYGEIVLNSSNGWWTTVDNLPKTNADASMAYEYYVVEEGGAAYGASYAHTSDTITVTNTEMPSFTNLTVAKNWKSQSGADVTSSVADSAQLELWQVKTTKGLAAKPGVGDVVKIQVSDNFSNIPEGQGNLGSSIVIRYKVVCSDANVFREAITKYNNVRLYAGYSSYDNYTGSYLGKDYNPKIIKEDGNTFIIEYNIPTLPEGITFTPKSIKLKDYSWENATSKELVGTPDLAGGAIKETKTITESLYDTFTLSAGDWTKQYSNLPKASADGNTTYEYYVKEVEVPADWSVAYDPADASSADKSAQVSEGTVNVTNTIPGPSTVSVTATKAWDDSFANHPEVTFTLYRKAMAEGESAPMPRPATVADARAAGYALAIENDIIPVQTLAAVTGKTSAEFSDDEKTVRWDGLPEFDDEGNKYDYLVIENPVNGYSQKMAADVLNSFAFVNTPETLDLTVTKSWVKNGEPDTSENLPNTITYKVFRTAYSDPSRSMPVGAVETVTNLVTDEGQTAGTLTKGNNWTQTLKGLPKFTIDANGAYVYYGYYIEEDSIGLNDYVTSYQVGDGQPVDVAQRAPIDMSKAEAEATIINGTYSVTVNVLKVDANTSAPLTGATFQLRKSNGTGQWVNVGLRAGDNGAFVVDDSSESYDMQVDANGRLTIEGLTNGTYQFVETQAPGGYLITNEAPITFTVSNGTLRPTSANTARYESADQTFFVPNTPGDALPTTGGSGTVPLYVLGAALVAGAGVLLATRTRRRSRR